MLATLPFTGLWIEKDHVIWIEQFRCILKCLEDGVFIGACDRKRNFS